MAKKKKKRKYKIKNIIIILLLLLTIIIVSCYVLMMPIKNIYIKNNDVISDDEIINTASLYKYPSFLLTKKNQLEKDLEKNAYIKECKVKKKLKNIIEITITEYKVIALTPEEKIILENGDILDNDYNINDIPTLINTIENKEVIKNFTSKFGQIDKNILRQISQIEYTPVTVDDERFLLYMNDGNLVYITLTKINKLNKYNHIKDKLEGKKGVIYLDSGNYVEVKKI